ncbi:MAG: OmpA family protein [Maritimibacter sp.]
MIDSHPKNETLRALAFPLALFGVTAAVFFGVTTTSSEEAGTTSADATMGANAPLVEGPENIEEVSFDYSPDTVIPTETSRTEENDINSAVSASLTWSTKSLPDQLMQTRAPADALTPASPEAPAAANAPAPFLQSTAIAASHPSQSQPITAGHGPHGAADESEHGDHEDHAMMDMATPDPNLSSCVAELKTIASRTRVYFGTSTAAVPADAKSAIYQMAALAQRCPEANIVIDGFTDPKGDVNENLLLSWKRANNVLATIRDAGFATGQFSTHSHMDNHPDYCLHYDVVDRRVEFVVTQNPDMAKTETPLIDHTAHRAPNAVNVAAADVPRIKPLPRPH